MPAWRRPPTFPSDREARSVSLRALVILWRRQAVPEQVCDVNVEREERIEVERMQVHGLGLERLDALHNLAAPAHD